MSKFVYITSMIQLEVISQQDFHKKELNNKLYFHFFPTHFHVTPEELLPQAEIFYM